MLIFLNPKNDPFKFKTQVPNHLLWPCFQLSACFTKSLQYYRSVTNGCHRGPIRDLGTGALYFLVFKKFCVLFQGHSHTQGKPRNSHIIICNFFLKLPAFLNLRNTSWIGGPPFLVPLATEPRVDHPAISQTLHSCGCLWSPSNQVIGYKTQ